MPVLCLGAGGAGPDLTARRDVPVALPAAAPAPESFLQTSGTTGTPKLVHHRESFYAQILALAADFRGAGLPLLRHLSHSPMWLASGQITTLFNLFTGGVLFLRQQWDPAAFIATVDAERISSTFVTPPMLYEVLDHPALDGADFAAMFMFNVGAGPAAPARLRQAIARFGPCLRIVYGLSEAVVICALPGLTEDPAHPERLRSCGRPYGDVTVQIRDADGTVLPPGADGEVWARSEAELRRLPRPTRADRRDAGRRLGAHPRHRPPRRRRVPLPGRPVAGPDPRPGSGAGRSIPARSRTCSPPTRRSGPPR